MIWPRWRSVYDTMPMLYNIVILIGHCFLAERDWKMGQILPPISQRALRATSWHRLPDCHCQMHTVFFPHRNGNSCDRNFWGEFTSTRDGITIPILIQMLRSSWELCESIPWKESRTAQKMGENGILDPNISVSDWFPWFPFSPFSTAMLRGSFGQQSKGKSTVTGKSRRKSWMCFWVPQGWLSLEIFANKHLIYRWRPSGKRLQVAILVISNAYRWIPSICFIELPGLVMTNSSRTGKWPSRKKWIYRTWTSWILVDLSMVFWDCLPGFRVSIDNHGQLWIIMDN